MAEKPYYLALRKKNGAFDGIRLVLSPEDLKSNEPAKGTKPVSSTEKIKQPTSKFKDAIEDFIRLMDAYRNFMPSANVFARLITYQLAATDFDKFARSKGRERKDLAASDCAVFEMGVETYPEFMIKRRRMDAVQAGGNHLPEIMLIGLISIFDAYLSALLKAVAETDKKFLLGDDKSINLSELEAFSTLDEAKNVLVQREIDALLRQSYNEQFELFQRRFKFEPPLKSYFPNWANLVEICERRNLFTHTGGVVSNQYVQNCKKVGIEPKCVMGEKIGISADYFTTAVTIIFETGMNLGYIFWRHFSKGEAESADSVFNKICYDLIIEGAYPLAGSLLKFAVEAKRKPATEELRLMFVVNYANCLRLSGKGDEAKNVLDREDWTASDLKFKISVAAIREDASSVIQYMKSIGAHGVISSDQYRTWPVFVKLQGDHDFQRAFQEIFGEPLIRFEAVSAEVQSTDNSLITISAPDSTSQPETSLGFTEDMTVTETAPVSPNASID